MRDNKPALYCVQVGTGIDPDGVDIPVQVMDCKTLAQAKRTARKVRQESTDYIAIYHREITPYSIDGIERYNVKRELITDEI